MTDWMEDGDCRDRDPELWFPLAFSREFQQQIDFAISVCRGCPVRTECLTYATDNALHGIWGGTTDDERLKTRRRQKRQKAGAR